MKRKLLLQKICFHNCVYDCVIYGSCDCVHCEVELNKLLNEYDNHVIEQYKENINLKDTIKDIHDNVAREMYCKGVDDFANWLVEQGILGNRCISDGEITDYGKVYAKKYKEQLKEGGENV